VKRKAPRLQEARAIAPGVRESLMTEAGIQKWSYVQIAGGWIMKEANNVPPGGWRKIAPIQARLEAIETVRGMAPLTNEKIDPQPIGLFN